MKSIKMFLFASLLFTLASCSNFADGTSVWGKGLWLLPWITGVGGLLFMYMAYLSSKSNSTTTDASGRKEYTGNVPIYKTGQFIFSVILLIVTIVIVASVNANK